MINQEVYGSYVGIVIVRVGGWWSDIFEENPAGGWLKVNLYFQLHCMVTQVSSCNGKCYILHN